MEAVRHAPRRDLPGPHQQPRSHPPGVPQQRRIGGIVDVGFHHGGVGADDVGSDHFLRNSIFAKQFVDLPPGGGPDGEEALVEEGEVHHGPLPQPEEVLEERLAADADDDLAEGQPFEVLHHQGPQNVFGGVVALAAPGTALGELGEVLVDDREDLGIVVEDLTDGPVSVTILAYDLWQSFVAGLETQHGFHLLTHPCSPMWSLNNHEDKDASFLYKPVLAGN